MKRILLGLILPLFLLTGCWDQQLIKDSRIVYAAAFDKGENGKVRGSAIIRGFVAGGESGGGTPRNEFVSADGRTIRNIRMNIDRKLSGNFTAAKNRLFLYSEELGQSGLYPLLDIFYREPSSSLNSRIAITIGDAEDYLQLMRKGNTLIAEYLEELITSAEQNTIVPKIDIQSICPLFFDPGKDPVIPYLQLNEENEEVKIRGLALFQDDKMTGTLNSKESTLLLILMNKTNKVTRLVRKIHEDKEHDLENFVTVNVGKSKSKMKVITDKTGSVEVSFDINLKISVVEYPSDNLTSSKEIKMLETRLSKTLEKDMNKMIKKMQAANSDVVGVGRELIAYHPETWKKLDWRKEYPNIPIRVNNVNVKITNTGIIN
ncbi:Ger(x)C family spore germination protein [Pseudalkalibacillus berkeleyi]|uniref:Ger(X)C family spore germination protein n=1 Tax=Pseudalkalibacillus berkeleyi TaxID=1069813 RepID=A0ABS9GV56_9BACL|nr:Ger(x)C family spore germination protein [Pseudalkalibacillus berkeleyi]MCF6136727.1 Ger(x)C family spore germination protein [Pseudalkalibacillus berkeleyi]